MTEDHKALLARVEAANVLRLSYPHGVTDPIARVSLSDLDVLLTLARRGAAAEGLVEALKWIAAGRPEFDSTHKANWARIEKATEALSAYTAATQSTKPGAGGFQGAALSTSTPGEAVSVAGGPIPLVADGHPSVTEGPGLGWKLSPEARDKIMELMRENVRSVSDLHSIILASLSEPCPDQPAEGEAS